MKYQLFFEEDALSDIRKMRKAGKRADLSRLDTILEELKSTPTTGTGKPEPLKHQLSGFWSRRINKKDRLVYEIIEEPEKMVVIVSALGHY